MPVWRVLRGILLLVQCAGQDVKAGSASGNSGISEPNTTEAAARAAALGLQLDSNNIPMVRVIQNQSQQRRVTGRKQKENGQLITNRGTEGFERSCLC